MSLRCLPIKFRPNPTYVLKEMSFVDFQDGCNGTTWFSNSEFLCHSDSSQQVSVQSDLRFGRRCRLKNSRWLPWRPSWKSEQNDFSSSESPCLSNASRQLLAQSDLPKFEQLTTDGRTDGRTTDYRPRHALTRAQNCFVYLLVACNPNMAQEFQGGHLMFKIKVCNLSTRLLIILHL